MREQSINLNIDYVDAQGKLACSAIPAASNLNFADRKWFQEARDRRRFAVGDYVVSRITGERVIVYAYPIIATDGGFRGVTYAVTNLFWLVDMVVAADLPPNSTATVVDVEGNVPARHPDPEALSGKR